MEKDTNDVIDELEKKIKAAHNKMGNRQLNSHTDILTKLIEKPEKTLDDTNE
jgi:hypothetical protein|tara:strand:- start:389 stop:544 length:156 start_codon:yes stop_codon:yes gene_type:complete